MPRQPLKPKFLRAQFGLATLLLLIAGFSLLFSKWREDYLRPVVFVVDNCDAAYEGKKQYDDNMHFLSASGHAVFSLTGLNNCETIGASHQSVVDSKHGRVIICEGVTDRVRAFSFSGRELFVVDGVRASSVAVDGRTGDLWCTVGEGLGAGEIVVIDEEGKKIAAHPVPGFDIAYSPNDESFWVVGASIRKIDRNGQTIARGPRIGWAAVSVAPDPRDGGVWLVERKYSQSKGVDRLIRLASNGTVLKSVKSNGRLMSVACDPATGDAWAVDVKNSCVLRVPVQGVSYPPLPIAGRAVAIGLETQYIWITTQHEVLRVNKEGDVLARYPLGSRSSQSWLSAY